MRGFLAAAAGVTIATVVSAASAQTVYPIDRADILAGARFDLKVEFPGLADPTKISVTLNGNDHAQVLDKAATFVEREDGKDSDDCARWMIHGPGLGPFSRDVARRHQPGGYGAFDVRRNSMYEKRPRSHASPALTVRPDML